MHKFTLIFFSLFFLSGCSFFQIHKPVIEQGNILTESKIHQLHTGMTPKEVVEIMGTPVLEDVFTKHEISYVYTYQIGNHPRLLKKVICTFRNGRLKTVST